MKITLSTTKLQEMVSKAIKGVSNNKLLPLTSLLSIELKDGTLTMSTTDMSNYLFVKETGIVGEDFLVTIVADLFAKLIGNTTSNEVTLTVTDSYLEVKGNGTYKIGIELDENGDVIRFPQSADNLIETEIGTINASTVKVILNSLKPGLATTYETPCYTNYFFGDKIVATDTMVINSMNTKLFTDVNGDALYISSELMDLVGVCSGETISVRYNDGEIQFVTDDCVVYGKLLSYAEAYQISDIQNVIDMEFGSMCKIDKTVFLQTLDRIALFIDNLTDGVITLTFTKDGLIVTNKADSGSELIPYKEVDNFNDFVGVVAINQIRTQVKANISNTLEIWFGEEGAIKLVDTETTSIIGLVTED